ncbi:MAG TPA: PEP-CTERM sorting domain-containing protein [Terriglobia bacterium]|nr:PEP-CTERM sorting domain-containing protein [Terriglobia bacterium]
MKLKVAAALVALAFFAAAPGWASTVTFDFTNCSQITSPTGFGGTACHNADLGQNTATYTSGGLTLTATGMGSTGPADIYVKFFSATDERGLGLVTGASDHEIHPGDSLYLDLSDLASKGITSGTLWLGSLSTESGATEVGNVCATDAVGTPGTSMCVAYSGVSSGSLSNTVSWSSSDPILSIQSTSGGFLVGETLSVTQSTVPEPSTLVLFGTALLAGAFLFRRRLSSEGAC